MKEQEQLDLSLGKDPPPPKCTPMTSSDGMDSPMQWLDFDDPGFVTVMGDRPSWSAIFTSDQRHRLTLRRPVRSGRSGRRRSHSPATVERLEITRRHLVSCGINPSKADAFRNDNTVSKEIGFAERWNCEWYVKVNVFAWRDTYLKDLWAAQRAGHDIVGPRNDDAIVAALSAVAMFGGVALAAWGNDVPPEREQRLRELAATAGVTWMCLGKNKSGSPKHSLYPPYSTELVQW